jgi:hypothetical protein
MKKFILVFLALNVLILSSCTKDFGKVEVSYTKATAIYDDLDKIRATPLLEEAKTIINPGKIFVSEKLLLVGEEGKGIHIVDNTNPETPTTLSFLNIPGNREFFIHEQTLYAESYYDMLKIDLSDKMNPRIISRVKDAFATDFKNQEGKALIGFHFEEVTEVLDKDSVIYLQTWGEEPIYYYDYGNTIIPPSQVPTSFAGNSNASIGSVNRIAYYKEHVYVISRSIINTFQDFGQLELLSSNYASGNMETVYPNNDKLFIGTSQSMEVFDLRNPSTPEFLSSFWHPTSCDPVLPDGDVAFVTLRTGDVGNCPGDENALLVLDINNLRNPIQIQEIEMESPFGMSKAGSKLYVGEGANGLKIFDASDKRNLSLDTWDKSIEAYDIIHHPVRTDLLLIAGPNGISQYQIEASQDLSLISTLSF